MDLVRTPRLVRRLNYVVVGLFFILFSGLRWRTGADWGAYYMYFRIFDIDSLFSRVAFEPGYVLLTYFVKSIIHGGYTCFLLIFSFLIISLRFRFFKQNTKFVFIAILLFWGNVLCEVFPIRQSLGISICLLSLPYIKEKRPIIHILISLLGMQFHFSLILWLAAYPVYHVSWSIKWKIVFLILAVLIGMAGFLNFVLSLISAHPILGRFSEKASGYTKIGSDSQLNPSVNEKISIVVGIVKRLIIFPVLLYFEKRFKNVSFSKEMNLFVFGNVLYFLVVQFVAMQRISTVFYAFEIILLCRIFELIKEKRAKFIWYGIFCLYSFVKMTFIVNGAKDYMVPYYWINSESFERPPIFY